MSPTKTFEGLKSGANLVDGLKLVIIVSAVYFGLSLISSFIQLMRLPSMYQSMVGGAMVWSLVMMVVMMAVGILLYLFSCWLVAKITASIGGKQADFGKTVGLMAYVEAAFMMLILLPIMIIGMIIAFASPAPAMSYGYGQTAHTSTATALFGLLMFVGIILLAVWEWLIAGRAAATANDTTWGAGIAGVLIAGIILAVIMFVIMISILGVLIWGASSSVYVTGYAIAGL